MRDPMPAQIAKTAPLHPAAGGVVILGFGLLMTACGASDGESTSESNGAVEARASLDGGDWPVDVQSRLFFVGDLVAPEAVRYDPVDDVYLIGNWGDGDESANDGFITRVAAEDGALLEARWVVGSDRIPLQEPRGMVLTGDTLWIVDVRGVHAFGRATGAALGFVDLSSTEPGFLNDVAATPDGALWVTDTGTSRVIRIDPPVALAAEGGDRAEGASSAPAGSLDGPAEEGVGWSVVAEGPEVGSPNGITWDAGGEQLILVPWEPGGDSLRALDPTTGGLSIVARSPAGLRFDGIEAVPGRIGTFVVASQADSSLHIVEGDRGTPWQRVPARPADIAVDTRRNRVAVPYVAEGRVDVYALPVGG